MRALPSCIVIAAVASQLGATDCNGVITRDPGFDLWCGDLLCAWKLERGGVRRAATWHPDDAGVELIEPDTAIEQFTSVDHQDGTCIRFELVSDVAETAQAELAIDIYGDGSVERAFPIPTAHWKPVSYVFAVRPPFTGIRFEIAKRGPGHAVVARMRATLVPDGCAGVPELSGGPAPPGALCAANPDCASAICIVIDPVWGIGRCAGCDPLAPACGADQVCGLDDPGPPERAVPISCVAAGARVLGEQCLGDAECETGVCSLGACSICDPAASTCGAAGCDRAGPHGPYLCGAGLHRAARGQPCGEPADCASGSCNGVERRRCLDGRTCATDANCPVEQNLKPGPCLSAGVQGGSCG